MATKARTVHLSGETYDRLITEAERRGMPPDVLADELMKADLAPSDDQFDLVLADLEQIRRRVRGTIDAVAIVREGRDELERRGL